MAFPQGTGLGPSALARLASQAVYYLRQTGGAVAQATRLLESRVPGVADDAIRWAVNTGRKIVTAVGRAGSVGTRATFGGLFRGTTGLSPGYDVMVKVTRHFDDGTSKTSRHVIRNVVNADVIENVRQQALAAARSVRTGGRGYRERRGQAGRGAAAEDTSQPPDVEIVSIVPVAGTQQ